MGRELDKYHRQGNGGRMMACIKGRDTQRLNARSSFLHAAGLRYRMY